MVRQGTVPYFQIDNLIVSDDNVCESLLVCRNIYLFIATKIVVLLFGDIGIII